LLHEALGEDAIAMTKLPPIAAFDATELAVLQRMIQRAVNTPRTSSVGRLFDAFAALCGLRQRARYEGEAAAAFEWAATDDGPLARRYDFPLRDAADGGGSLVIDWQPALEALLADRRAGVGVGAISAAVHAGLAAATVAVAEKVGERRVALTGGCFQNTRLTESAVAALCEAGFEPLWHQRIPPNDGGIAFGQAAWAAWREAKESGSCA